MLKKLLKSVEPNLNKLIFPIQTVKQDTSINSPKIEVHDSVEHVECIDKYVRPVIDNLIKHEPFINMLGDLLTNKILNSLQAKYDFEPTDKYLEKIEDKKKYINQLDEYLEERKKINCNIENELQQFLQNTTDNIRHALDEFSRGINLRIVEAERMYGIDKIKHIILNNEASNAI